VTKPVKSSLLVLLISGKSSSPRSKSFPRLAVNDVYRLRLPVRALFASLTDIISQNVDTADKPFGSYLVRHGSLVIGFVGLNLCMTVTTRTKLTLEVSR